MTEITEKRGSAWVEISPDGVEKLVFKWRGRGVFSETFNLKKYPFDVQRLSIRLISRRPASELVFIADDDGGTSIDNTNFMEDNEVHFHQFKISRVTFAGLCSLIITFVSTAAGCFKVPQTTRTYAIHLL